MWLVVDGNSVLKTIYDTLIATNQLKYYRLMKKTLYYILQQAASLNCSNIIIAFDYSPYNKLNNLQGIYKRSEWINSFEVASLKQDADIEQDPIKKKALLELYEQGKVSLEQQKVYFKAKNRLIKDYANTQLRIVQVPHEMTLDIIQEIVKQLSDKNQKIAVISNDYNIFSVLDYVNTEKTNEHSLQTLQQQKQVSLYNIVYKQDKDKFISSLINIEEKYHEEISLARFLRISLSTMSYIQSLYSGTTWLKKAYIQQDSPVSFETFCLNLLSKQDKNIQTYRETLEVLSAYESTNIPEYVTKAIEQTSFEDTKAIAQFKQICTILVNFYTQLNCPCLE